jgi:hypothetical protein
MSVRGDRSETQKRLQCTRADPSSPARAATMRTASDIADCTGMVRVIVKLRPEQYDELFRHVRAVGSTMSAFFRESVVKAMREEHPGSARGLPP